MNISNRYDYSYKTNYQTQSLQSSKSPKSSFGIGNDSDETEVRKKNNSGMGSNFMDSNLMGLSFNGSMVKNMLQMKGTDSTEMKANMEQMKTDMDSLKSADVDSMTVDDMKSMLTKLESDRSKMPKPHENTTNSETANKKSVDVSNMSETDMRNMLKNIQKHEKNGPKMPPMMDDMMNNMKNNLNSDSLVNSLSSTDDTTNASGMLGEDYLQQIIDKLTSGFDSTSQANSATSASDYTKNLKESLSSYFNKQKSSIDELSNSIFDKLDKWSATTSET